MVMAQLPDDLIKAILLWLPVKSLMQFKCVDKSWCAMIGDPYFAEQHRTHSALRPDATRLVLMRTQYQPEYEQTILNVNCGATFDPIPQNILEHGPFYVSCCQGLISMHPHQPHKAKAITFVYNPNTRETVSIPFDADDFKEYTSERTHIGFEPVSGQYKLVILGTAHEYGYGRHRCEIITLGGTITMNKNNRRRTKNKNNWRRPKNNWRQVFINGSPFVDDVHASSTCTNGALHWLTSNRRRIVVFYLKSEEFGTILSPEQPVVFESRQIGGHLTLVEHGPYRPDNSFQLWTLKDYHNNVWVKQSFQFSLPQDLLSTVRIGSYLRVFGAMNSGEILMTIGVEVFAYDMKTKKNRKINVGKHHQPYLEGYVLNTESMRCY